MFTDEMKVSICESVLCWLATVDEDGVPNCSPKEIFLAHGTDELLIANLASPNSMKNISHNANVCVSFVHILKQKGFKLQGVASYYEKDDLGYSELLQSIYPLTGEKYPVRGIIRVKISKAQAIVAPSYHLFPEETEQQKIDIARQTYIL